MKKLLASISILIILSGCSKDDEPKNNSIIPSLNINLKFKVDSIPMVYNQIDYLNEAGNMYGIKKLEFYLSQICLVGTDSSKHILMEYLYVDGFTPPVVSIPFTSLYAGNYIGLSFNIGIDSIHNVQGGLPNTPENLAMEWPNAMGGGYHFLKLEGNFTDTSGTPGYAMHLGTNSSLCPVSLLSGISISNSTVNLELSMNVNEWFRDPYVYDFNVDGNYSMGNMSSMSKLTSNAYNVFTLK